MQCSAAMKEACTNVAHSKALKKMEMLNLSCLADRMAEAWPVEQCMAQILDILSLTIMLTRCRPPPGIF